MRSLVIVLTSMLVLSSNTHAGSKSTGWRNTLDQLFMQCELRRELRRICKGNEGSVIDRLKDLQSWRLVEREENEELKNRLAEDTCSVCLVSGDAENPWRCPVAIHRGATASKQSGKKISHVVCLECLLDILQSKREQNADLHCPECGKEWEPKEIVFWEDLAESVPQSDM